MKKTWRSDRAGIRQMRTRHKKPAATVRCCGNRKRVGYTPMDGNSATPGQRGHASDKMTGWQPAYSADSCLSALCQSPATPQPIASVSLVPRATAVSAPDVIEARAPHHHQAPDLAATAHQDLPVAGTSDKAPLHRGPASMKPLAAPPRTAPTSPHIQARQANPLSVLKRDQTGV